MSIEEDIKRLNDIIKKCDKCKFAICEQLERISEMPMPDEPVEIQIDNSLTGQIETLPKDIQIEIIGLCSLLYKNYIPKQKIKDLKEKIQLDNTIVGGRRNAKTLEYGIKLGKIKACEELLQESEVNK